MCNTKETKDQYNFFQFYVLCLIKYLDMSALIKAILL